jgi:hypothetical protein
MSRIKNFRMEMKIPVLVELIVNHFIWSTRDRGRVENDNGNRYLDDGSCTSLAI